MKFLSRLIIVICFSLLCGCSNSRPVSEDSFTSIQTVSNSVDSWNAFSADFNSTTATHETEAQSEAKTSEQETYDENDENNQTALEVRINQLFEQAVRLKDIHKRKNTAIFCEPTSDGKYLIYQFEEIDTYEKYAELLQDTYTEELVNDYFQKAENGRMVNLDNQLAVPTDSIFKVITEEIWEDGVSEVEWIDEDECYFTCASYVWIQTDYGPKKVYDTKYVTAVLCEDGKWRLDRTSIDFDYAVPAEEVNLFVDGSPMEAEIRRLCDQNILLMDMFTRKYEQTYYEVSTDGSYAIYKFGDIDTYSKYKNLLYNTYLSKLAENFLYHPYGFDDFDDHLIVYSDKAIMIIDNIEWEDYKLEILWQSKKKCFFQCIAFEYIGGEYETDGTNIKVYEMHKAAAVLCDDGQWRLECSFF